MKNSSEQERLDSLYFKMADRKHAVDKLQELRKVLTPLRNQVQSFEKDEAELMADIARYETAIKALIKGF